MNLILISLCLICSCIAQPLKEIKFPSPEDISYTRNPDKIIHGNSNIFSQFRLNKPDDISFYRPIKGTTDDSTELFYFEYDSVGNMTASIIESYHNNTLDHIFKYTYTYDSNDSVLSIVYEIYRYDKWSNYSRILNYYNENGNLTSRLYQEGWSTGDWINVGRTTNSYDTGRKIITILSESWEDGRWKNSSRHNYTYGNNNQTTNIIEDWRNDSIWVNYYKYIYTYNDKGNIYTRLLERWKDNNWLKEYKRTYSYNDFFRLKEELSEFWADSLWERSFRIGYNYDGSGNIFNIIWELPDVDGWRNYWKDEFTYDEVGNAVHGAGYYWYNEWCSERGNLIMYYNNGNDFSEFDCKWVNVEYKLFTIKETPIPVEYRLEHNYPNPFNNSTIIKYSIPYESRIKIQVYNILGQLIKELRNEIQAEGIYEIPFNGNGLASGVYLYTLISESNEGKTSQLSEKMILLK